MSLEAQIDRTLRLLRCLGLTALLWFMGLFWELEEGDNLQNIPLIVTGISLLLYLGCCYNWCGNEEGGSLFRNRQCENPPSTTMTSRQQRRPNASSSSSKNDYNFPEYFVETGDYVKYTLSENDRILPPPVSGTYDLVLAAVYFGKTVRSEGTVALEIGNFVHTKSECGYSISGSQQFSSVCPIIEGYWSASTGLIYWKVESAPNKHTIYRGKLSTRSDNHCLFNGEFETIDVSSGNEDHCEGRIVRMELQESSRPKRAVSSNANIIELSTIQSASKDFRDDEARPLMPV